MTDLTKRPRFAWDGEQVDFPLIWEGLGVAILLDRGGGIYAHADLFLAGEA